ncbi:DegV family protein [Aerococcus sp. Group 2]|uniref:DegV family protein n=1 Tax=Aerococcus sp. Group 2 TaxID=2976811 RepID=UPI00227C400E|nr:DegV family protein [Aerococcus sp. Group 2]MCY3035353.1 DegV family protein [Aerococcus sp. Group 2]
MKTAIITDSTAALPESLAKHPDVYQVYLQINLADGSTMTDTSDRNQVTAYYHSLASMKTLPRTSQPSMGEVVQVMDDLVAKGYDEVLIMTFPSGLEWHLSKLSKRGPRLPRPSIRLFDGHSANLHSPSLLG